MTRVNYFNYFTEIEEHFQHKRGAQIWLSPMDWSLIESWRQAGIPLPAVLAGIDQAFEKFESGRRRDTDRHRALAYCAAAVMEAAEAMRQAAVGAPAEAPPAPAEDGFSRERIATHLRQAEERIAASARLHPAAQPLGEILATLQRLRESVAEPAAAPLNLQELDRTLSVLDEKLHAWLLQSAPVEEMVAIRAAMERELAPYRRGLRAEQLAMIERQFTQRRLLEDARLPRLSLFYLGSS